MLNFKNALSPIKREPRGSHMKTLKQHCRELRKNQTPAEQKLWAHLRNRKLEGYKFLRQYPIIWKEEQNNPGYFIVDFYCSSKKLAIEVDGGYHSEFDQKHYDSERDILIKELGISVLRFRNDELKNIDKVLQSISQELAKL